MRIILYKLVFIPAKVVIKLLFILSMFHVTGVEAQQPDSWQQKKNFPESVPSPRIWSFSFTIGDKGYMGTGYIVSEDIWKSDFWEYDAATDTWSQKAEFPKQGATGFSIGGKGYGISGPQDFWEYDPVADRWLPKAGLPDSIGGIGLSYRFSVGSKGYFGTGDKVFVNTIRPLMPGQGWEIFPALAGGGVGFNIGDKGYFGLGGAESGNLNDFWEYDPAADNWTQKNNFPAAGYAQLGLSAGSKGYIGADIKDFWEYDPARDSWTRQADFIRGGYGDIFAFAAGGQVYIGSGEHKDNFWQFNAVNNTWTGMRALQEFGRTNAAGFSVGTKGYFGTGYQPYGNGLLRDFWEYDPALDSWTQKADFGGTARDGAVGLGIGGKGYIGTGKDSSGERNDFWEYDPVTNTWLQKPDYPGGSVRAANSFTIGNKGYLIEPTGYRLWEYNPAGDQWTQKATFTGDNSYQPVSFAIGNKGYYGGAGYQSFYEYDPVTDTWNRKASILKTLDESRSYVALNGTSFSIGNKGYLSVRIFQSDAGPYPAHSDHFYEYDPQMDEWVDRALSPVIGRTGATGISIGNKGYSGFGYSPPLPEDQGKGGAYNSDLWEYTPVSVNSVDTMAIVTVPGTSNPYLAGMPDGTQSEGGDVAPANSPVLANVKLTGSSWIEVIKATGAVAHASSYYTPVGPEGCLSEGQCNFDRFIISHLVGAENGKSGLTAPINSLVAVFLNDQVPTNPVPQALDFSTQSSRNYLKLYPQLQQIFFIGDGRTDEGTVQKIFIPKGASRLYLGTMDGGGWNNNFGSFCVTLKVAGNSSVTDWYKDADGDGYGNPAIRLEASAQPEGYVADNTDCNDYDITIHAPVTYFRDLDRDGYGDSFNSRSFCSNVPPPGYVTNNYDCYDSGTVSHPEYVRVRMCHDGWTQCVNAREIQAKLCLGWTMGPCSRQSCAADETLLCHNGRQECVKTKDVALYLARDGWWAGPYCSGTPISKSGFSIAGSLLQPFTETAPPASFKIVNYPNPFTGTTTISYALPLDSRVSIIVYDQLGRQVVTLVDEYKKAGSYTVPFRAPRASSGSFFYRLTADSNGHHIQRSGQMIRMK